MIESITLCINHSTKVRKLGVDNAQLDFKPGYNVLIGPNGSGKSTVLRAIASCTCCRIQKTDADERVKYVTTETLNPAHGGTFSSREQMLLGIRALFKSHGQSVLDTLEHQWHKDETIILIDSPETGQDYDNSQFIHRGLLKMAEEYQVLIATNSLVFMQHAHVIDLGEDYLQQLVQYTGNLAKECGFSCKEVSEVQ
ncbi:MAG: AAA family ATPase [Candidatus Hydrogenedentota bacterium]